MKRFKFLFFVAVLVGSVSIFAYSQDTITPEDAAKFIGQHKTVCGKVASAHFAAKSKGQPTFINLDKPYPNQVFTWVEECICLIRQRSIVFLLLLLVM